MIDACKERHSAIAFRAFLDQVEAAVPADLEVHLVLDNAVTRTTKLGHDRLVKRPRWHLPFRPGSASWLNLAGGRLALPTRRRIQRGVLTSTADLEAAIQAHLDRTNAQPKPFVWSRPADDILPDIGGFCQRISNPDDWRYSARSCGRPRLCSREVP